jgi:site-specific DNA-adenine methylase
MNYGIPYKGSKNKIAEKLIEQLPPAKHFYDLFGGGGAMTHCALLSGKYEFVHYNELNPLVFKAFKMAINGEFKGENRWISREDFKRLKDTDPYVACCFSFGNNFKVYCYSIDREPFKKAVHYSIFFDDNSLLKEYINLKDFKYSSNNIKERRLELQRYFNRLSIRLKHDKSICNLFRSNGSVKDISQNIESLERLERLERLNNVGVLLSNLSYEQVPIEENSVIYCDPPYINTDTYLDDFNHEKFYQWLRKCREKNRQVFISEYQMPDDFHEVFSINKRVSFGRKQNTCKLEKLFSTLKSRITELLEIINDANL